MTEGLEIPTAEVMGDNLRKMVENWQKEDEEINNGFSSLGEPQKTDRKCVIVKADGPCNGEIVETFQREAVRQERIGGFFNEDMPPHQKRQLLEQERSCWHHHRYHCEKCRVVYDKLPS